MNWKHHTGELYFEEKDMAQFPAEIGGVGWDTVCASTERTPLGAEGHPFL